MDSPYRIIENTPPSPLPLIPLARRRARAGAREATLVWPRDETSATITSEKEAHRVREKSATAPFF